MRPPAVAILCALSTSAIKLALKRFHEIQIKARGSPTVAWFHWAVGALAIITGGWMLFDGIRYLVAGDYTTPGGKGELGPWTHVVSAVGLEPRSTLMASIFVASGLLWLAGLGLWWWQPIAGWWTLVAAAALTLWYLPIGTATALAAGAILLFHRP